jgi:glycosyltransferase 2 family protein
VFRRLRYADDEVELGYRRVERRIEHEAFALTLAERHGVRVPRLVAIGGTKRGAAFLVTEVDGDRPATVDDLRSPAFLDGLWRLLAELHAAGVAHRRLELDSLRVDTDGQPMLRAFHRSHIAPSARERARDVAALLTETAIVVGPDLAVRAAVDAVGPAPVADSLRMLQSLALPSSTRERAKTTKSLLDELRAEVGRVTGVPDVELERLERVRPRTLLIIGASTIAFYSLLPQLANLGDTVESFAEARPLWLVGAVTASISTYLFAAISFQGAITQPIPFAANLRSQSASSFATLVGPAGAGGYALNARFLQRNGLRPAEAAASVTIDGLAGFAMHAVLLTGFIVWSGRSGGADEVGLGGISLPAGSTVLLVLAILLALVGVVLAIGPVRTRVARPVLGALRTGGTQIASLLQRPVRVVALLGGSIGISLSYVTAVACSVQAFGGGLTFAQRPRSARGGADRRPDGFRTGERAGGGGGARLPARDVLAPDPPGLVLARLDAAQRRDLTAPGAPASRSVAIDDRSGRDGCRGRADRLVDVERPPQCPRRAGQPHSDRHQRQHHTPHTA